MYIIYFLLRMLCLILVNKPWLFLNLKVRSSLMLRQVMRYLSHFNNYIGSHIFRTCRDSTKNLKIRYGGRVVWKTIVDDVKTAWLDFGLFTAIRKGGIGGQDLQISHIRKIGHLFGNRKYVCIPQMNEKMTAFKYIAQSCKCNCSFIE